VVQLQQKAFTSGEISLALQVSQPLVAEYLKLYEQNDAPFSRQRLTEQIERLGGRQTADKRGAR
jgi:hypothetical protein